MRGGTGVPPARIDSAPAAFHPVSEMHLSHASCVALAGKGVLLRGPSGAGKSDLALRLIDGGGELVADDQVLCHGEGGVLFVSAPPALSGLIEVRGLGLIHLDYLPRAELVLVVDLVAPDRVERLSEPALCRLEGIDVPCLALTPFEASAPAKLRLACAMLARGQALAEDVALPA